MNRFANASLAAAALCVAAAAQNPNMLLTYSQSAETSSEWFADQTQLFSDQQWRPMLSREEDIAADPNLVEYEVSGG